MCVCVSVCFSFCNCTSISAFERCFCCCDSQQNYFKCWCSSNFSNTFFSVLVLLSLLLFLSLFRCRLIWFVCISPLNRNACIEFGSISTSFSTYYIYPRAPCVSVFDRRIVSSFVARASTARFDLFRQAYRAVFHG